MLELSRIRRSMEAILFLMTARKPNMPDALQKRGRASSFDMKPKPEEHIHHPTTVREKESPADQQSEHHAKQEEPFTNPTPLDLDDFLPWVCLQWNLDKHVVVKRVTQEPFVSKREKPISTRTKLTKVRQNADKDKSHSSVIADEVDVKSTGFKSNELEDTIQITTIYDFKGNLVEIALNKQYDIPLKMIYILCFCFQWHTSLTKLSFCDGGLTPSILHEIAKMLPLSNITELIFNGNVMPEANYYILFENTSLLSHLSLSRCGLNDIACTKLIAKLESGPIQLLDLSCNVLTDDCAKAIGHFLRFNRSLLHLNISGNRITTSGARAILDSFAEFPLTAKEIMDMKRRQITFIENNIAIYSRSMVESARKKQMGKKMSPQSGKSAKNSSTPKTERPFAEVAEYISGESTGEFNDPFNFKGTVKKNEYLYCKGNFVLCSLNISYNNLDYLFVQHILKVLKYQDGCMKYGETGLLRVVMEGNDFPVDLPEYILINELLRLTVFKRSQSFIKHQKITIK